MCILCVIQKWSRRVATMLPWLVMPVIGLWTLSQLLPPPLRFEITSPRLACVFMLLVTLFWYEILMPQLSAWRDRRNARLRERKRLEAIEMQKLRKTATRRCRNCLNPYKDQNPAGGRFMCSYCGHISKRPVLDLPVPSGLLSNSGILKDLVGKGGNILNGKLLSDNGWTCGQDWLENGNWVRGSFAGKSCNWWENGGGFFIGDDHCMAKKSYSQILTFFCKALTAFFWRVGSLWRKSSRITSYRENALSDAEHKGIPAKRGENGVNFHESKEEKARRKAEEKRQARLERELREEEERKQREEVARLVEERRRLRGEKLETVTDGMKGSTAPREKESKKETENKHQQRIRKEKDKAPSSKSSSDAEELEKKAHKESERKWEFDRKSETDQREYHKYGSESAKAHSTEITQGRNSASPNNHSQGNAGTRFFDRVRKESSQSPKSNMCQDDRTINRPVFVKPQPMAAPKKSWQQLFTRSSSVPGPTSSNVISRPNGKSQEVQCPIFAGHSLPVQPYSNPINFGLPSPFMSPTLPHRPTRSTFPRLSSESVFPRSGESPYDFLPEESDIFEDPCYLPDPLSLLGPVSESLDIFPLDLGTGFTTDIGSGKPCAPGSMSALAEVNRPSPIGSPLSRSHVSNERHSNPRYLSTSEAHDMHTLLVADSNNTNEKGAWQMWSTSPLGQGNLGPVGSKPSWLLPPELKRSNKEDLVNPFSHKALGSLFTNNEHVFPATQSPTKISLGVNLGTPVLGSTGDPWLAKTSDGPIQGREGHFSLNSGRGILPNEIIYGSPITPATNPQSVFSSTKKEWPVQGSGEVIRNSLTRRAHIGGMCSAPNVQSVWSYD